MMLAAEIKIRFMHDEMTQRNTYTKFAIFLEYKNPCL